MNPQDEAQYYDIVSDILNNPKFHELEKINHHHTNRLEHSQKVSICAYKIAKKLHLDCKSSARGGLLHDFFTEKYLTGKKIKLIKEHPSIALTNSKKYFSINAKEENIIESHMFPINIKKYPKYLESIIVCTIDKISYIHEISNFYLNKYHILKK